MRPEQAKEDRRHTRKRPPCGGRSRNRYCGGDSYRLACFSASPPTIGSTMRLPLNALTNTITSTTKKARSTSCQSVKVRKRTVGTRFCTTWTRICTTAHATYKKIDCQAWKRTYELLL